MRYRVERADRSGWRWMRACRADAGELRAVLDGFLREMEPRDLEAALAGLAFQKVRFEDREVRGGRANPAP